MAGGFHYTILCSTLHVLKSITHNGLQLFRWYGLRQLKSQTSLSKILHLETSLNRLPFGKFSRRSRKHRNILHSRLDGLLCRFRYATLRIASIGNSDYIEGKEQCLENVFLCRIRKPTFYSPSSNF